MARHLRDENEPEAFAGTAPPDGAQQELSPVPLPLAALPESGAAAVVAVSGAGLPDGQASAEQPRDTAPRPNGHVTMRPRRNGSRDNQPPDDLATDTATGPDALPAGDDTPAVPTAAAAQFKFHIDDISETRIEGWILCPDRPGHRLIVALCEADTVVARAIASRFRADLVAAGLGDGCHSFLITMPATLRDGEEHLLQLVEQESGAVLTPEPLQWRSERPTAQPPLASLSSRIGATRLLDMRQQPDREADSGVMRAWSDTSDRAAGRGEARYAVGWRGTTTRAAPVKNRILFDISDLIYYIGEHANLTGIQRVQSSIVLAILGNELFPEAGLTFLSFNAKTRNWMVLPTGFLFTLLEDLFLPESQRLVSFPAEEARYGVLPGAQTFTGAGVLDDGSSSVLCLLGAAWVHQDYLHRVLALKRQYGTKFVMTVHDLIPIYAAETCDQDTARVFEEFMRRALRHADHLLSVSENTAADIKRYTDSLMIPTPPITVTRNGSSFGEFMGRVQPEGDLAPEEIPERFVLFVATIEGRKNHDLMLRIWHRMVRDGDDPPHLVCVGRLGWKSSGFISALVETDYLGGRIHLLRDISDTDLQMLYTRCLFTVCPTFYEGWGLPVGESLAMGKICVSSDRASVPEVAGEFGTYVDIDDFDSSLATIRDLIADGAKRKRLEAKIRRGYKPVTWRSVAEKVVEACRAAVKTKWQEPYPYTLVPYSSEISFAKLDRAIDGTGELLLTRIAGARRGLFLGEALDDRAFQRGEEVRTAGSWAYPEDWGTWACHGGGEVVLALPNNDSACYYVFVRLRASGPTIDQPVRISANGDLVWEGTIGPHPRVVGLRVRRKLGGAGGWRLRLRAQVNVTPELERKIAVEDARTPTLGFERMIVVPDNDLKTRLDVMYSLLL